MFVDLTLLVVFALLGVRLQRWEGAGRFRERLWRANYVLLIPLAAVYAFLSIELDRELLTVVGCAVGAWWLTVLAAGVYAALVAPPGPSRGALWLVAAFPNTGFIGYPLAHLAFGREGLRLAVIYDQVSLVVPAIVVATIIARRYGGLPGTATGLRDRGLLREVAVSPPLWTVVALLLARVSVLPDPVDIEALGTVVGHVVGPVGFLLLGLSVPLHGFSHAPRDVMETGGACLVRVGLAPALVWIVARAASVEVPVALYLIAAMPTAFHALVLSRIHGLDVGVLRLGVLLTSSTVIGLTVLGVATGTLPGG